jgi:hypothetical protein
MVRQYLTVPVTSVSPERFFSRVGLVQTLDGKTGLLPDLLTDLVTGLLPGLLSGKHG